MNRKLELTKGQKVIVRYINDRIRYLKDRSIDNIDKWTITGEVTKVGRKYIEVNMNGFPEKFNIEFDYVQKTNIGSPDYKLYLSIEDIIEEIKAESIFREIGNHFDGYGRNKGKFTIDQLERIMYIINENNDKSE